MLRRPLAAFAAALSLAVLPPAALRAQAPGWAVASWTTADGLPSNVVLGIEQTADGFLWLASYQGLVRFDGVAFKTFSEDEIPGMDRASFFAVASDARRGALWAASESNGLARYQAGQWRVFTTKDGLTSDRLTALHLDAKGTLWVGTREGVCTIVGSRVGHLPRLPGSSAATVTALVTDARGDLWIGTAADGVFRWDGHRFAHLTVQDGLGDDRIASLHVAAGGDVWVGGYGAGVTRIVPAPAATPDARPAIRVHAATGALVPRRVNEMLTDERGALWIGADNGLFRLAGEAGDGARAVSQMARPDGRPLTQVDALRLDGEGSLWVGSRNGGVLRVRDASVRVLTTADGLPHDVVFAVDGDGAGGAWIATLGGVLHRAADGRATSYTRKGGALRDDVSRDLLRDRRGDVWIATNGGLTRVGADGRATTLTTADGVSDDRVRALLEARDGALWAGTFNGLTELRDGRVARRYGHDDGLNDAYVLSVFQDRAGTIWVGTQSTGLFKRVGDRFVPGPASLARLAVFRMTDGPNGALWAGTSRGLARVQGDSVAFVGRREGLPGNAVFQAIDDGLGALWLTGPWGIGRARRGQVDSVATGLAPALDAKHFGSNDGLLALEATSISRAWRAGDGSLWFPTSGGVAVVDPRLLRRNLRPPPTHVEEVVVDGAVQPAGAETVAPPGTRKVEFLFTAPSFVSPEQVKFRYRLDGFDQAWVDAGTLRRASYTNLAPGEYTFRVQARNEDGVWSASAASLPVTLEPHVWQTRWFLALVVAFLLALALVVHRLRVRVVTHATREEMLRSLSLRDDLTGLYNRRGLLALAEQQVRSAERARTGFAVVFVDMDGLKDINDSLGHRAGDRAIGDAATLLRATFRESDVIARLGGDEFAALVPDADTSTGIAGAPGGAEAAIARLAEAVSRHNATAQRPYQVSLSVGIARFDPGAPLSLEALLEAADRAMYEEKRGKPKTPTPVRGVSKLP